MTRPTRLAAAAAAALALTVAAACADLPAAVTGAQALQGTSPAAEARGQAEIAELRRALAPYRRIERAFEDKFSDRITPCWYHGADGAMGYHYGELARIDGTIERLKPEALLYEPGPQGQMKLVAAEYIVPLTAWTQPVPPRLYGRDFDRNDALGLWVMHVWLFKENPNGLFAPWNPKVSCEFAEEKEDRGAH